ncbi:zinc-binding dehydrogenase [Paenibacillus sp. LHD-117]|uniref:zinc-binding dehydrogenase n=1 Tax=Paenibacillus sp. LHD-117 TaxID=3071412 RepID=UPI0035A88A50
MTILAGFAKANKEDLDFLGELLSLGHLQPVIDTCFPFERIAEAHSYVDQGRKKGNVILTIS